MTHLNFILQVEKQAQLTASAASFTSSAHLSSNLAFNNQSESSSQSSLLSPKAELNATNQSGESVLAGTNISMATTSPIGTANKYQQSSNAAPLIPGYSFAYNAMSSTYNFLLNILKTN